MKVVARGGIDGPTFQRAGLLHRHGDFTMPETLTGCETKKGMFTAPLMPWKACVPSWKTEARL